MKCYHLELMLSSGANVIIWDEMLSSRTKCYHLGLNAFIWDEMLSSGANVIIWNKIVSSGTKCYHLGWNVIIWTLFENIQWMNGLSVRIVHIVCRSKNWWWLNTKADFCQMQNFLPVFPVWLEINIDRKHDC